MPASSIYNINHITITKIKNENKLSKPAAMVNTNVIMRLAFVPDIAVRPL